jgi:radical SAM protein with 4Fe4S-binding SPASM domain
MSCPALEDLYWDDFLESGFGQKLMSDRVPFVGTLEVTERCNVRCVHCYLDHQPRQPELSLVEIQRIFDQAAELGCFGMLLTGGEPLVRRDFLDIYTHAKKCGFWVTLFTNGTLITPEIVDYLEEWRPRVVDITVYGATAQTYEAITGIPGSFEKCLRGIELILDRGIPLALKTMVLRQNAHELEAIKAMAVRYGVPFRFDAMIHSMTDGCQAPLETRLSPEEAVRLDREDEERSAEWRALFASYEGRPRAGDGIFRCGAGNGMFLVDSYGWLSPCRIVRSLGFSLREMSFREGWYNHLPAQLAGQLPAGHRCSSCEWSYVCLQCPGWSESEHGNLIEPVDHLCRVTHLRAQVFGNDKAVGDIVPMTLEEGARV